MEATVPVAGVFGGGGLFGIGYALGVLDGLRSHGVDLSEAPMLGTSAGSWAAAATAAGITFDELAEHMPQRVIDRGHGALARVARHAFGERTAGNVSAAVCRLPLLSAELLSGAQHPLADLVAASSAVPGLFAPHRVGGHLYVDGGVRSGVRADQAAPADRLIVIAPLAGAMFGPAGILLRHTLHRELERQRRGGGEVVVFAPDAGLAANATLPHHLFDETRAHAAYTAGSDQARRWSPPAGRAERR
jgi:hypothetical protein